MIPKWRRLPVVLFYFENCEELMFANLKRSPSPPSSFEIENVLVKRTAFRCRPLDGRMIASINLYAHISAPKRSARRAFLGTEAPPDCKE
jgi:hypothetical protein